jgi:flagellar basal-body rod modification protein FlgD
MSVSSTEGVASSGLLSLGSTTSTGSTTSASDYDSFLQLLVAQLKYQDPMNPTDSTQLMAQNAQYTSLQKTQEVADGVTQLLSLQMSFGAAGMIGRQVSWVDADGNTQSGIATGVSFPSSGPVLTVGDNSVPVASVTALTDVSSSTGSGSSTSSGSSSTSA